MLITIFTPTYNRAHLLPRLYESIKNQSDKNFEWIIVDDGSNDNTEAIINVFQQEDFFPITYLKQENGGKHRAINNGLKYAQGTLFFIVDSDDSLPVDSTFIISRYYDKVKSRTNIAGIVGLKYYLGGNTVGTEMICEEFIGTTFDYRYKLNIKGDRAEVYKTAILSQYSFPEIEGENFISESIVWDRISLKYEMLFFNKNIYECDYQNEGLSKNSIKLRANNPIGTCLLYSMLIRYKIPLNIKLKTTINYWRFSVYTNFSFCTRMKQIGFWNTLIVAPLIFVFIFRDKTKLEYHR